MVDSRQKGSRAEAKVKEVLKKYTGLNWQRVPGSGALHEKHMLKGDLYVPDEKNIYAIEVKHYKDDHLTSKVLTDKSPQIFKWWEQAERQAEQVNRLPLLIFKFDRSKLFVMTKEFVSCKNIYLTEKDVTVCLLEEWLKSDKPKFIA